MSNTAEYPMASDTSDHDALLAEIHRFHAVNEFEAYGTILTANDRFLTFPGFSLVDIQGKHHRIFCDSDYHVSVSVRCHSGIPDAQCGCGGSVVIGAQPQCRHQVFDIPDVRYSLIEYQLIA